MKFTASVIIFFLSMIALVAEIVLYFIIGMGASIGGAVSSMSGLAAFFVWLWFMTAAAGFGAPIFAVIEHFWKRSMIRAYVITVAVIGISLAGLMVIGSLTANP